MNILVTGSKGQLGSEIKELSNKYTNHNFIFTDVEELDITIEKNVIAYFDNTEIDTVINCAAYTNVDKCESDQNAALNLNAIACRLLAKQCNRKKASLIHISTDYVYDGKNNTPYTETDFTNPNSVYGKTKLQGEQMIEEFATTAIIIRTSWLYSSYGHNFIKTMLKYGQEKDELKVVFDQIGTPTYARDLAEVLIKGIEHINFMEGTHIFHYSNEGVCSWYDFAKEISKQQDLNCQIVPILTSEYPLPAPRPPYSVLDKSKIKDILKIEIPHWSDSLTICLNRYNDLQRSK